ncbi:MAG: serine hydroxymethyltransferase [Acidimicrobiia bacterium]|nr:serine hydroxymethyltransferase [Acidimicrobiia bacterium]
MNRYLKDLEFVKNQLEEEAQWRSQCLNLIASENVTSPVVAEILANDLSHRYGSYKGLDLTDRRYRGNRQIVSIEEKAHELCKSLFDAQYVDLRPLSGHLAGIAVIMAFTEPGDAVMEIVEGGGHRLNQRLSLCSLTKLRTVAVPFDAERFNVDLEKTERALVRERPKLVILGSSQFLFPNPVREVREMIDRHSPSTLLLYDASHVLGLIAGKQFQQPLAEGAHMVSSSTHKTLGGPQGGLFLTNDLSLAEKVGEAIYPGIVTNHHLNRLPALAATFIELQVFGSDYAKRVIDNAQRLAQQIHARGVPVAGERLGFTQSHTVLLQTSQWGAARAIAGRLEDANIIATDCTLPAGLGSEGIRLGTQEMTRCGMQAADAPEMAELIASAIRQQAPADTIRAQVKRLRERLNSNPFVLDLEEARV